MDQSDCNIFTLHSRAILKTAFSPVKEVLTFSPMDTVAKLGKSKKRSVSVSTSTDEPVGEGVPLIGDGPTEGSKTFMKKVKELQNRLKKIRNNKAEHEIS